VKNAGLKTLLNGKDIALRGEECRGEMIFPCGAIYQDRVCMPKALLRVEVNCPFGAMNVQGGAIGVK